MPTLKIIEYKPSEQSIDVVVALLDKNNKEIGRTATSIPPTWNKREAITKIKNDVKRFLLNKQDVENVKVMVAELDGLIIGE